MLILQAFAGTQVIVPSSAPLHQMVWCALIPPCFYASYASECTLYVAYMYSILVQYSNEDNNENAIDHIEKLITREGFACQAFTQSNYKLLIQTLRKF